MNSLRYGFIVIALLLFSWNIYVFLSIDEAVLKQEASGGAPTRFIQADEVTLTSLNDRLKELTDVPAHLLRSPNRKSFGRDGLFLPD